MKIVNLLLFQIAIAVVCNAQSYSIDHFQSSYDTMINYNSVNIELGLAGEDPYYWEKSFDFGFEFPFYGEKYNKVFIDSDGVGYFPGSPEFNIYLFAGSYTVGEIIDTSYLHSEVRYTSTSLNNIEALVIEYHNVYNDDEYDENGANHSINFQIWFYENGVIELRFGAMDLTDCSYYFPGQGFSFDNVDPTKEIYGPWVSINNNDFSESACFFGDHSNPTILYDDDNNCGVLTSVPPDGYVVQFSPSDISSLEELNNEIENKFHLIQQHGKVKVMGELDHYKSCSIYDSMGRKIGYTEDNEFFINLKNPQIFIVLIDSKFGQESHKLIVK